LKLLDCAGFGTIWRAQADGRITVIPERILKLIRQSFRSAWDLELLLLLRRNHAAAHTVDSLIRDLRGSQLIVADSLHMLTAIGLVQEEPAGLFRYRPATPELESLVEELEKTYAMFPVGLTEAIRSLPNDRIRTFADAFRLRKD
jgi:hypothetical protein